MTMNGKSQQRKEEIISAGAVVFDAQGYAEATMEDVARQAGISKGSIYNYFRNKKDLFRQVFADVFAADEEVFSRISDSGAPTLEKISGLVEAWYQRLDEYVRIGRLLLEFWATAAREERAGEASNWLSSMYSQRREMLSQVLAEGIRRGEFDRQFDPSAAAALIISLLRGITVQAIIGAEPHLDRDFVDSVKRAVLNGLIGSAQQGAE